MSSFFCMPEPKCPHCGYAMDADDMMKCRDVDLFALAPREENAEVNCPSCNAVYWVSGGYTPHYTSAVSEDLL